MKSRKQLGDRKNVRVALQWPGFIILAPDAPWIECFIADVSETGAQLNVGGIAVPEIFGLGLTADGTVVRLCKRVWRRGEMVGARFIKPDELRRGVGADGAVDSASKGGEGKAENA